MSYSIIELFEDQIEQRQDLLESKIIKGYCQLYRFLNNVRMSDTEIVKIVMEHVSDIEKIDLNGLQNLMEKLKKAIEKGYETLSKHIKLIDDITYVIMIGDGSIDGHGVVIEDKPYVIIDILALSGGRDFYDLDVFVIHESVHAIHYSKSPDMSFNNYNGTEDMYFKRLASEGIATFISGKLHDSHLGEEFWLGFLDKNRTSEWITYCTRNIGNVSSSLKKSIQSDELDIDLYYNLFSITDPSNIGNSRLAYYYGYEICMIASQAMGFETLMTLNEDKWSNMIKSYFELK